jgi:hypothetical protein
MKALERALPWYKAPETFNSSQENQFADRLADRRFVRELEGRKVKISINGRRRCLDNIFHRTAMTQRKIRERYIF